MLQRLTKPAYRVNGESKIESGSRSPKQTRHISRLDHPKPPVVVKVTHHSIELTWERPARSHEKSENRLKFTIQEEDKKTKGFGTVYIGYANEYTIQGLLPLQVYKYRLKVTDTNGDSSCSSLVSVCTTKEPYNGEHMLKSVMQNNEETLLKILSTGDVSIEVTDKLGYTPLMNASQKGYLSIVNILLEHGADVHAENSSGKNSVMLACFAGHLDVVKRLRLSGATWTCMDRGGSSPLHWAVDGGNTDLIDWMVTDGAKVDAVDNTAGWTPLLRCTALSGNKSVAQLLINLGSNVNATDFDGKTPLMIATLNSHTDLVKLLVVQGADFTAKNKYGKSAYDMAKSFDRRAYEEVGITRKPILRYFEEIRERPNTQ